MRVMEVGPKTVLAQVECRRIYLSDIDGRNCGDRLDKMRE